MTISSTGRKSQFTGNISVRFGPERLPSESWTIVTISDSPSVQIAVGIAICCTIWTIFAAVAEEVH